MRSAVVRLGVDPGRADDLLREQAIDPRARAERLSLAEFARIAEAAAVTASPRSVSRNLSGAENASDVSVGGTSSGGGAPLVLIGVALAVVALGGGAVMRFRSKADE